MKKFILMAALTIAGALSVHAQGVYFDVGAGFGWGWTKVDGKDFAKSFIDAGCDEMGIDLGLKLGFGPFGKVPLYIVGELGGIGHRIYDSSDHIQFNSYLVGGGVVFYPVRFLQLAGDIGYSYTANGTSLENYKMYNGKDGFAYNVSIAADISDKNHGFLFGVRYFAAENKFEKNGLKQEQLGLNFFIKYVYKRGFASSKDGD